MIFEICAIVSTLALVVLICALVNFLLTTKKSLRQVNEILRKVDEKVEPMANETITLLNHSNHTAVHLQNQLESFDPLLQSISDIGVAIHNSTRKLEAQENHQDKGQWKDSLVDLIHLAAVAAIAWQQIKKRE